MQDISLHILDIIENSVRAKASLIRIEIVREMMRNKLKFIIEDDGIGMDEDTLKSAQNPFYTSKLERVKKVGLGIPLFKQNAEMCNGKFEMESELGKGTRLLAVFQYDHLDRMPLGNMKDTFVGSIIGHQEIDFKIILRNIGLDGTVDEFIFSTREIKEELGDIPLSYPDVMTFIDQSIEEGIKKIKMEEF
jgi:signal transduction histidine kinase